MAASDHNGDLQHGLFLANTPWFLEELCSPSNVVEYAIAAEEAGWDGIFLADQFEQYETTTFDPWITNAAIATQTEHIRLASWITPLARRQPWQVAMEVATLDEISQGRVTLGTGLGVPGNYERIGTDYNPKVIAERYDEALDIVEALWEGDPFTHSGEHFTLDELQLPTTPVQEPRIPITMAFWWPNKNPVRRAARYDGIMPWIDPSYYGEDGEHQPSADTLVDILEDMITYYREVADDPGEIMLPTDLPGEPDDFVNVCRDLGATWLIQYRLLEADSHEANLERIRAGPPI